MTQDYTFNGKPCRKCGGTLRYKSNRCCVPCSRGVSKKWYADNPDRVAQRSREYRLLHKEELNEYGRAWRRANPEKAARYHKTVNIRKRFGIEWGVYLAMLAMHDGVCAICRKECDVVGSLAIDHDHKTGRVRGLLCNHCNTGLGKFRDDPTLLGNAITYLSRDFVLPDVGEGNNVLTPREEVNARDFNRVDESQDL